MFKKFRMQGSEANEGCRDLGKILGQDLETGWRGLGQYKGPGSEKSSGCRDLNRVQPVQGSEKSLGFLVLREFSVL